MGIPGALVQLARDFQEAGVRLYGVGGMVRNPRLGLPISDMDITSACGRRACWPCAKARDTGW